MLSADLASSIKTLLAELDASEQLVTGLNRFSELETQITPYIDAIAKGGDVNSPASGLHNFLSAARKVLPQLPSRTLYKSVECVTDALKKFSELNPEGHSSAVGLAKHLDEFSALYEAYLAQQTGPLALPVLRIAPIVLKQLDTVKATLRDVLRNLEPPEDLSDDEELFEIYFPGHHELAELSAKLRAIADILETVAGLGPSSGPAPIPRVLHIESGSLLVKLAIAKWIAGIVRPWISALAGYFYRNGTVEGSLATSPAAAKAAIKQTLDVRQLLNKAGIDTSDMDRKLEEAATAMAENVAILVRNQIRITFDDEQFDQRRFSIRGLEYSQSPRLASPEQGSPENREISKS